jgi:hypothetical protein
MLGRCEVTELLSTAGDIEDRSAAVERGERGDASGDFDPADPASSGSVESLVWPPSKA